MCLRFQWPIFYLCFISFFFLVNQFSCLTHGKLSNKYWLWTNLREIHRQIFLFDFRMATENSWEDEGGLAITIFLRRRLTHFWLVRQTSTMCVCLLMHETSSITEIVVTRLLLINISSYWWKWDKNQEKEVSYIRFDCRVRLEKKNRLAYLSIREFTRKIGLKNK